jgi:single-stranded-DNA-specific exonuclease
MAAGLTIEKRHFDAFCQAFETIMTRQDDSVFQETLMSDGELAADEFSLDFVDTLNNLAIWGHGFAPPIFDNVFVIQDYRVLKDKHLKFWLSHPNVPFTIEAIWFNAELDTVKLTQINRSISSIHLLYELDRNQYNQQISLQLKVKKAALVNPSDA